MIVKYLRNKILCGSYITLTTVNIVVMALICVPYTFLSKSKYIGFGPGSELSVAGIIIDTRAKYLVLFMFIILFNMFKSYRQTIIYPWVMNTIYDHKQTLMPEYGYWASLYIVNGNFLFDNIYGIFGIMIQISQLDLAVVYILATEVASIYVTNKYLKSKKYNTVSIESQMLVDNVV